MALPLSICTYNMQGFNDVKCDYIQKCIDNHDIIMIQEHWLYESQSHVFEDNFPNITSLCVSGMDDSCLSAGRRYGGCVSGMDDSCLSAGRRYGGCVSGMDDSCLSAGRRYGGCVSGMDDSCLSAGRRYGGCVSGMDDSCLSAGRRYGGCAILCLLYLVHLNLLCLLIKDYVLLR